MKKNYHLLIDKDNIKDLFNIFQFGLIKIVPGLANLALIPYLILKLGSGYYGIYSLYLSYAIFCTTVLTAVLTQPMYRFFSSKKNEESMFNFLMLLICFTTGLISFIIILLHKSSVNIALGFGFYSSGALLTGFMGVKFQINNKISQLAKYESLRLLIFLLPIIFVHFSNFPLGIHHLLFGLIISNLFPFLIFADKLKFSIFDRKWFLSIFNYGSKSSLWLLLAGIPIVVSKTLLASNLSEEQFGIYAAITDISYKGFAFLNAAITMWSFPKLSKLYESQFFKETNKVLKFSLSVYVIFGGLMIFVGVLLARNLSFNFGTLSIFGVLSIIFTNFTWQAMSITHKPYELNIQTGKMLLNLFIGVLSFFLIYLLLINIIDISYLYSVTIPPIIVAVIYCFHSFRVQLKG